MIRFRYVAARADGQVERGTVDAAYVSAAIETLRTRRLTPTVIMQDAGRARRVPVRKRELAEFLRGVSAHLAAGLAVERALESVAVTPRFREVVDDVVRRVRNGEPLSAALGAQPAIPSRVIARVRAGERGDLPAALERAAATLERTAEAAPRPAAILGIGIAVAVGLIRAVHGLKIG